jgi:hypothetical protein
MYRQYGKSEFLERRKFWHSGLDRNLRKQARRANQLGIRNDAGRVEATPGNYCALCHRVLLKSESIGRECEARF